MNRLLVSCSLLSLVLAAQSAHAGSFRDAYLYEQSIRAGRPSPGKVKSAFQTLGEQHKAGTLNLFGKGAPTQSASSKPPKTAPKAAPTSVPNPKATPAPPKAPLPPTAPPPPTPASPLKKTKGAASIAPPPSPSIAEQIRGNEARDALRRAPAPVEKKGRTFLDDIVLNPMARLRNATEARERAEAIAARSAPKLGNRVEDPDKTNYLPRGATAEQHYNLLKGELSSSSVPNQYNFQKLSPIELSLLSLYDMAYGDGSISQAIAERLNRSVTGEPTKKTATSGKTGIDALDRIRAAVAADNDGDEDTAPSMPAEERARPLSDEMSALAQNIERFEYLWKRFLSEKTAAEQSQYFTPKDNESLKATLVKLRDNLTAESSAELNEKRLAMSRINERIAELQEPKRPESRKSAETLTDASKKLRSSIQTWGQDQGVNLLKLQKILTAAADMTFSPDASSGEHVERQLRNAAQNAGLDPTQVNSLLTKLKTKNPRITRLTSYPLVEVERTKTIWVKGKRTIVVENAVAPQTNQNGEGFSPLETMALALDQERPYQESLAQYNIEIDTLRKERRELELKLRSLEMIHEAILSPLNDVIGSFREVKAEVKAEDTAVDTPASDKPATALDALGRAIDRFKLNTPNATSADGGEGVDEDEWSDDDWGSEDWD